MRTWLKKIGSVGAVTAVLLVTGAGAAWAHVSVSSPSAVQGGYGVIVFRVPTESATASTTGLRVQLPTETPLTYVGVQPKPGWSYTVVRTTLATPIQSEDGPITEAISEIDWTATGTGIAPGEFDQFQVLAGPFPEAPSITFKAIQHYSDNSDVAWVETPAAGSAEPEHPAPTLALAAGTPTTGTPTTSSPSSASGSAGTAGSSSGVTVSATGQAAADDTPSQGSVTIALVVAAIALVVAAVGIWLGLTARRPRDGGRS